MRTGFTTGTCAALAARAAVRMLLGGRPETTSSLITPKGVPADAPVENIRLEPDEAACAVRKDAGDDPDSTDGVLVRAAARKCAGPGIVIDGGTGIGRVTRPGLDQPVGAAAINSVPRRMIEEAAAEACREFGYGGGITVTISVPDGERLAAKTFNPRLGIAGGISILGTTGIVEPMSARAVVDAIAAEMDMLRAEGVRDLVLTPGNYGEEFVRSRPDLSLRHCVMCSNHIGEALDIAAGLSFGSVIVAGHAGKLVKLAGGVMNTHSRTADCRMELLALHAALAGAEAELLREILDAATVDAGLDILAAAGLRERTMNPLLARIDHHLDQRSGGAFPAGAVLFTNKSGRAWTSPRAGEILQDWKRIS